MTPTGSAWNEATLSEDPAVEHLQRLGYLYVPPDQLDAERAAPRAVLEARLARVLRRLNPWLSDDNVHKAVRAVTGREAASLIEASEQLHTVLTYGIAVEQDRGDGKRSHLVRYFDFADPKNNEFVVTRQYRPRPLSMMPSWASLWAGAFSAVEQGAQVWGGRVPASIERSSGAITS